MIHLPAIEVRQGPRQVLYTFAVDGKLVHDFAVVSRVKRGPEGEILGYQRPEVKAHIQEIGRFVDGPDPLMPNAVIIAFDSRVTFTPGDSAGAPAFARPGVLHIPLAQGDDPAERAGFIVDGQQRLAAVRGAKRTSFPLCVSAFITDDLHAQTEQFILVNSTKPLPKGLIYELLPATEATLPGIYQRRRLPAELVNQLNQRRDSPLFEMISTTTNPRGIVAANSLMRVCDQSLTDGRFRDFMDDQGQPLPEPMLATLLAFFAAVKRVFKDAWGKKPKESRLMHGAGIVALGFVMDAICQRHRATPVLTEAHFVKDLTPLKEHCRWTSGFYDFGPGQVVKWNELQNTPKDIQRLTQYLSAHYKKIVWEDRGSNQLPLPAQS